MVSRMLETVFTNQIRSQRPYYIPVGNPIKGVGERYWSLTELYQNLVRIKQQYLANLDCDADLKIVTTASERLNRIQRRISQMSLEDLPPDLTPQVMRSTINKLNGWGSKDVHKLLQSYSDGAKSQLPNPQFLTEFLVAVVRVASPLENRLNLLPQTKAKRASLKLTANAVLSKIS